MQSLHLPCKISMGKHWSKKVKHFWAGRHLPLPDVSRQGGGRRGLGRHHTGSTRTKPPNDSGEDNAGKAAFPPTQEPRGRLGTEATLRPTGRKHRAPEHRRHRQHASSTAFQMAPGSQQEGSLDDSQPLSGQGSLQDEVAGEEEDEEDEYLAIVIVVLLAGSSGTQRERLRTVSLCGGEDKDYCTKFEHILNKCSADLMTLTLSYLQKNLDTVNAQISAIENQLTSTMPQEEFQELKTKNHEMLRLHRSELEKKKRSKFLRDTEDYLQNRVYQWRDVRRFTRRHSSLSSSGSTDSRPGTSNPSISHPSFLGNTRGRQKGRRGGGANAAGEPRNQMETRSQGLSFCPTYKFNSFELSMDLQRFYRNLRLRVHFSEQPPALNSSRQDKTLLELRQLGLRSHSSYMPPRSNPPVETFVSLVERDIHNLTREMDRGSSIFKLISHTKRELHWSICRRINLWYLNQQIRAGTIDSKMKDFLIHRDPITPIFYILPKIHKRLVKPPGRPIVSLTDSVLSPLSMVLEKILTPLVKTTRSFLLDTSNFIQIIKSLGPLAPSSLLVTWDVNSLYTSIVHEKGLLATDRILSENRVDIKVRHFCADLLGIVLKENYFMFQDTFYAQLQGTAMGANVAPPYAIAYMAAFESDFVYNHPLFMAHCRVWRRYIDDIFCVWDGPIESLLPFDQHINSIWPELKFTLQHDTHKISFLDTLIYKEREGRLGIDLFTKPTDRNGLLHFSSCHPPSIKRSIPKSQFHRVDRIVSDVELKRTRLTEMEQKLTDRGYPQGILTGAKQDLSHNKPKGQSKENPHCLYLSSLFEPGTIYH
ncbi:unnamed protein product [Ranitomeya imitator]|uniref:Reverse transcriptase domain-containing protein n=1 Tax=Ranitomeya imitator TaxID=111125 RepID=A0ABN9LBA7_9NEOB|nr:unnamed protein product [Ranitomeya imitator]